MTNNIKRRLLQHNGYLSGGGKYTSANRPWHLAALIPVEGDNAKSRALKIEYWTKAKNYPVQGWNDGTGYVRPAKKEIPTDDPIERRVWLLRETIRKHGCPEPLWFDAEFESAFNCL